MVIFTGILILIALLAVVLFFLLENIYISVGVVAGCSVVLVYLVYVSSIKKFCNTVKSINFSSNTVDLSVLDTLSFPDKDLQFILNRFCHIADAVVNRIEKVQEVVKESETDALTGLKNRIFLRNNRPIYEDNEYLYLIFMDLNNLKKMNDIFGHDAGDAILMTAADRLKWWEDYGDVYRLGGDEFMVIIAGRDFNACEKLMHEWYPRVGVMNRASDGFQCRFSYGVARGYKEFSIDEMMRKADEHMYYHKRAIKTLLGEPLEREG